MVGAQAAEKVRCQRREEILGRQPELGGEGQAGAVVADGFARRVQALQDLHGAQGGTGQREGGEPGGGPEALRCHHQLHGGIQPGGDAGIKHVLRMARQDLHGHAGGPQQQPARRAVPQPAVDGQEDERPPGHRAKVGEMPGVDVREHGTREHEDHSPEQRCQRLQPAHPHPQEHAEAREEDVQGDARVDGDGQGQAQVEPVGRIEQRRLEAAEEGCPAVDVRVPEREAAGAQFVEAELAPVDELQRDVPFGVREDQFAAEERRAEREDGQRQQEQSG